jgi:hypothetical protein
LLNPTTQPSRIGWIADNHCRVFVPSLHRAIDFLGVSDESHYLLGCTGVHPPPPRNYGQQTPYQQPQQLQNSGNSGTNGPAANVNSESGNAASGATAKAVNGPKLHWSQSLTDKRDHDFGAVPKASKQEHVFSFVNQLDSELKLLSVWASCGCTKPTILTSVVQPGETAKILAKFDTLNFDGQRGATVTVRVQRSQPYNESAEVQFTVKGMIRRDVVLNPGAVDFGNIAVGQGASTKVRIMYAGNPSWNISEVRSSNSNVSGNLVETRRDPNSRRIDYELEVQVSPEHPAGILNDELTLVTNDSASQFVRIPLSGLIKQTIQASPIQLGDVTFGSKVSKTLILNGSTPFSIKEIRKSSDRLSFTLPEGSKPLHMVKYEFEASHEGPFTDTIVVVTDDPNQGEVTIPFSANVKPQAIEATYAQNDGN